jgi:hypothetical protein
VHSWSITVRSCGVVFPENTRMFVSVVVSFIVVCVLIVHSCDDGWIRVIVGFSIIKGIAVLVLFQGVTVLVHEYHGVCLFLERGNDLDSTYD